MTESDFAAAPLETLVQRRLTEIVDLARESSGGRRDAVAAHEIPPLVAALRSVLAAHRPNSRGRCRLCRPTLAQRLRFGRDRIPCRAYLSAHLELTSTPTGTGLPDRRPPN